MANVRFFPQVTFTKRFISEDLDVTYTLSDGGTLSVYCDNSIKCISDVKPYSPVTFIQSKNNEPIIYAAGLPEDDRDVLLWLCGFAYPLRARRQKQFDNSYYRRSHKSGCGDKHYTLKGSGDGWSFKLAASDRADQREGPYRLAAIIKGTLTKDCVKEVLIQWGIINFPQPFVDRVLREHFDFTEPELDDLYRQITTL